MLHRGMLSDYIQGVAVKTLRLVETTPSKSNQHEFNGVRGLRDLLGEADRREMPATFIWLGDEQEGISEPGFASWYDSRRAKRHLRAAEYRLYYPTSGISRMMKEGDTIFIALMRDQSLLIIVTPANSTVQSQLIWLFGVGQPAFDFQSKELDEDDHRLDFSARFILDEIGIEPEEPDADRLDALLEPYGTQFPPTKVLADLARASLPEVDPRGDPDVVLMAWIEREELLFRRLERRIVGERLRGGFAEDGEPDVDGFVSFSLAVQNRRKSRAGHSLEHHLETLFRANGIRQSRGAVTENRNRPDFLFPGEAEYRDVDFPSHRLTMLGAKSTCKDRWRQVLSEAARISNKHLLTLEPGISENQTQEMQARALQLVLPRKLHETYRDGQRAWLLDVRGFIGLVRQRQQ